MRSFCRFLLIFLLGGCVTVPITGRRQVNLLPESELMSLSISQYEGFLDENKTITGTPDAELVKKVGQKVARAAEEYMVKNNQANRIKDYDWEFNLVDNDLVNAWCLPGGKVVVYTGILPVTQNEIGLAVVLGHEIAHAIARHGNERMSQLLLAQLGGVALGIALHEQPETTRELFLQSYGLSSQLGILGFSRTHEVEADKIGLVFMAMAGYDPRAAIDFWQRMANLKENQLPEFLSTHPHDETRIAKLQAYMPNAMKYYNQ
ncbi:MAG: M48 family metallopeptidase [Salibacteraceae bacterium]